MGRCPDCEASVSPVESGSAGPGKTVWVCPECEVILGISEHAIGG